MKRRQMKKNSKKLIKSITGKHPKKLSKALFKFPGNTIFLPAYITGLIATHTCLIAKKYKGEKVEIK